MSMTSGHSFKAKRAKSKEDVLGNFFIQRVLGGWSALPEVVMVADTIGAFERL